MAATPVAWLQREEAMFRHVERVAVAERLEAGFFGDGKADVDGFLKFSLGVQNRRKSRMGYSFEHHLAAVFDALGVTHSRQNVTERGNKPDFVFPGAAAYHDAGFPAARLSMLAAKATCKERWRQILPEAARIPHKHLATLEPRISAAQTDQMIAADVQLVVPAALHASYSTAQQGWLWSIADFVAMTRDLQR